MGGGNLSEGDSKKSVQIRTLKEEIWALFLFRNILRKHIIYPFSFDFLEETEIVASPPPPFFKGKNK